MAAPRLTAVPERPGRADLYVRVSEVMGRQADEFHSPDIQIDAMRSYTASLGLVEADVVQDIDKTGRNFARAGVERLMADAVSKKIDAVVVQDYSRLGRNVGESLRVIRELRDLGVRVLSAWEKVDDSTPEGQYMLTQFLAMAELYSNQMGRRWQSAHAQMARSGRQVGQPPLGYYQEATDRRNTRGSTIRSGPFLVDPAMAEVVRRAFADYAAGVPTREVTRRVSDGRGKPVWPSAVRQMLRNRFYIGMVTYKGQEHPGSHEPLVDEVTFERCQRRLAADGRTPSRRLQVAYSLSGLVVCDVCNQKAALRATTEGPAGKVRRVGCYRQGEMRSCTGCGAMRLELVEAEVLRQVEAYLGLLRVDDAAQVTRRANQASARASVKRLEGELRRSRADRARHAVAWAQRKITEQVFADGDALFAEAEESLIRALADAELSVGLAPRRAAGAAKELLSLWGDATDPERNRMLREVVTSVRLRPGVGYRSPVDAARVEVVFL